MNLLKDIFIRANLFALLSCFPFLLSAQQEIGVKPTTEVLVPEYAYIHTDKLNYLAGDTLWMKAYLVKGGLHLLSPISGAIYIELNYGRDKITSIKLPVINGMAKGNFILPDTLFSGNYTVRAYTQWMRNFNVSNFFSLPIKINNPQRAAVEMELINILKDKDSVFSVKSLFTEANKPLPKTEINYEITGAGLELRKGDGKTDSYGHLAISTGVQKKNPMQELIIQTNVKRTNSVANVDIKSYLLDSKVDIQFMPEGGHLITGIRSKIGFKAIDTTGLGTAVTGAIYNQQGKEVIQIASAYRGMGFFFLTPEAGNSYYAKFTSSEGKVHKVNLPEAKKEGYTLSIFTSNLDTTLVRIKSTEKIWRAATNCILVLKSGGEILDTISFQHKAMTTSIKFPSKEWPQGVLCFSLLTQTNELVAERLFYNYNGISTKISISELDSFYEMRKKVSANFHAISSKGTPAIGSFSIAVVNENSLTESEDENSSFLSSLLCSSGIYGNIESPNYYFHAVDDIKRGQMDILLLTQGYRKLLTSVQENFIPKHFDPEPLAQHFTGTVYDEKHRPVGNTTVLMVSTKDNIAQTSSTHVDGRFTFPAMLVKDSAFFNFRAGVKDQKLTIELDTVPKPNYRSFSFALQTKGKTQMPLKNDSLRLALNRATQLKEVMISAKKKPELVSYNRNGPGKADFTLTADRLESCSNLLLCLQNALPGVVFKPISETIPIVAPFLNRSSSSPIHIFVDGLAVATAEYPERYEEYLKQNAIVAQEIESIELLKSPNLTNMYNAPDGVLLINTKPIKFNEFKRSQGLVYLNVKGFDQAMEFYSPKYDVSQNPTKPDFRSTLYWNPSVVTGNNGSATFSFFNGDVKGVYRITIEGIGIDGGIGRSSFTYRVN